MRWLLIALGICLSVAATLRLVRPTLYERERTADLLGADGGGGMT